ncbi:MAG: hypothetical protein ACLTK8_04275 [Paeniclostridium sp.]
MGSYFYNINIIGITSYNRIITTNIYSNIVNVGIQQSGIENGTIKAIRESEMNKLTTFMNDSDKEKS